MYWGGDTRILSRSCKHPMLHRSSLFSPRHWCRNMSPNVCLCSWGGRIVPCFFLWCCTINGGEHILLPCHAATISWVDHLLAYRSTDTRAWGLRIRGPSGLGCSRPALLFLHWGQCPLRLHSPYSRVGMQQHDVVHVTNASYSKFSHGHKRLGRHRVHKRLGSDRIGCQWRGVSPLFSTCSIL